MNITFFKSSIFLNVPQLSEIFHFILPRREKKNTLSPPVFRCPQPSSLVGGENGPLMKQFPDLSWMKDIPVQVTSNSFLPTSVKRRSTVPNPPSTLPNVLTSVCKTPANEELGDKNGRCSSLESPNSKDFILVCSGL